ncbi:C-5 cytosine methyltransferase DmtA [Blastomyces dermatitidis ATCC 18188]|uniref:DNA (cytosine-5-)-methyltransferase n=1 Tax=Ajellomyces dermatitidis (strain ATCC 18188 / CBS 674.68) TaxID=653446 RepID=F2TQG1_AJEDA|nr:C-5 cytosine methyltransferase DmtA [Blastomyces dermatitidis ATCC 18188]
MVQIAPGREPPPLFALTPRSRRRRRQQIHESHHTRQNRPPPIVIDESDSSDTLDGDEDRELDFTARYNEDDFVDDEQLPQILSNLTANIAPCVNHTAPSEVKEIIPEFLSDGKTYKSGKSVELRDGSFLRILEVARGMGGEISLRGWRLQRQDTMDGLMPERINELCWIVNISDEEAAAGITTQVDEVGLHEVNGLRIIRFTNKLYPMLHGDNGGFATEGERRREGILFCRAKYIRVWTTPSASTSASPSARKPRMEEQAIQFLRPHEADSGYSVDACSLRFRWRGETRLGGSYIGQEITPTIIDLSTNAPTILGGTSTTVQQYTFGDGFCGAGGVSRGALQAGLRLNWGFDHSLSAMDSFRLNFESAIGYTSDVADFLANSPAEIMVDILHFSPPCQTFSPAKTIAAATDDDNEACIFCARELLERTKPRVVTMEETAGLQQRHEEFLFATINAFAELGYSCRWKLLRCQDYGVPQSRQRLVILASGPGEPLPPFPKPTHGPPDTSNTQTYNTPVLPRYRTIHDAISAIPPNHPDHDVPYASRRPMARPPYDPHTQAKTITCNGGENYHPSGTRTFTYREFACLQTFPLEHRFCGKSVKRQIGNAVPPVLGRAIFLEVRRALEGVDGVDGDVEKGKRKGKVGGGVGVGVDADVREMVEIL